MKPVLLLFATGVALSACASTSTTGLDVQTAAAPAGAIRLDLVPHDDSSHTFPALVEAHLPSADRLGSQIRYELGANATVDVELCVAGAAVTSIAITKPSGLPAFDAAVTDDARAWRFAPLPGPASLKSCERATITYRPHAS